MKNLHKNSTPNWGEAVQLSIFHEGEIIQHFGHICSRRMLLRSMKDKCYAISLIKEITSGDSITNKLIIYSNNQFHSTFETSFFCPEKSDEYFVSRLNDSVAIHDLFKAGQENDHCIIKHIDSTINKDVSGNTIYSFVPFYVILKKQYLKFIKANLLLEWD